MKHFANVRAGGFHITFPNGVTLSTQFRWGNYCENYNSNEFDKTSWESNNAEIAIWGPGKVWITEEFEDKGDDVIGYVSFEKWLKIFDWCRQHEPILIQEQERK